MTGATVDAGSTRVEAGSKLPSDASVDMVEQAKMCKKVSATNMSIYTIYNHAQFLDAQTIYCVSRTLYVYR